MMGAAQSTSNKDVKPPQPSLIIAGLATQWPKLLIGPDDFDDYTRMWSNPSNNPRSENGSVEAKRAY